MILDPAPFESQTEGQIETDQFRDTVETGTRTVLCWTHPSAVSFAWTLDGPVGSAATLDDPSAAQPSFTPDLDGRYTVSGAVGLSDGSMADETRRITSGAMLGAAACTPCHMARADLAAQTRHTNCERCHGPGSEHNSDPRNIAVSLRSGVCAGCHGSTNAQWDLSDHAKAPDRDRGSSNTAPPAW